MSPTAFLMIHDPSTCAQGNITEMQQVLDSMKAVKEGIINAYERKAKNISREKIAELMSNETWLDYNQAKEYGFVDGEIGKDQIFDAALVNTLRTHQMAIYNMYKPKPVEAPVTDKTEEPSNEPTEYETDDSEAQLQRYRALCLKARK